MIQLGRKLAKQYDPLIVAEIGQNHQGDVYQAVRMIGAVVKCGVDAVKFQLRDAELEYPAEVLDAPHPNPNNAFGDTYRKHRAALDLTFVDLLHLQSRIYYNEWPVDMFVTPCHVSWVDRLEEMNFPYYKIASKDCTNLELIREVGRTGKPVILSTGMSGMSDIAAGIGAIGHDNYVVLQCTSSYPCAHQDVNIKAMETIKKAFGCHVGISDHTLDITVPALAVATGAVVVEKHFTQSRKQKGTDHAVSLEPYEFREMVLRCRAVETIMGTGNKVVRACEADAIQKLRPPVAV